MATDDPLVPLVLLVYAMETVMTTGTCIVDFWAWDNFTHDEKMGLVGLYVPYLVLCKFSCTIHSPVLTSVALLMGVDMFSRLKKTLLSSAAQKDAKKKI